MREATGQRLFFVGATIMLLAFGTLGAMAFVRDPHAQPVTVGAPRSSTQASPSLPPPSSTAAPAPKSPSPTSRSATPRPTVAPTTSRAGRPNATNTGVPAGTSLKVVTGDQTFAKPNQVISGLDIRGFVRITAKNVTLKNSIVRGRADVRCNSALIHVEDNASATISDVELAPVQPHPCLDGVWATNTVLRRVNIHDVVDGVKAFDNVVVEHSYIHDLSWFASDPNQGGGPTHNDAVQTYEGNSNITLRYNALDVGRRANAAYQVTQDRGQRATNLRIEYNWLDGGQCTLNFSHKGGPTPMTGIYVIGNRFGRNSVHDCPILISTQTVLTEVSGNVWDDTGRPIPPPQRHD